MILVSHGIDTVRQLCDRVIMLERGEVMADGKPQETLRAYRERHEPQVQDQPDVRGNGQLKIDRMVVTDGQGQPRDRFESGDRLGVELEIEAVEPVDDPVVGVAIYNHLDQLMYGTNTALRNVDLGRVQGRRRLRIDFGPIPMVEGQYFVTLASHSRDELTQYHWLERQLSFKVFNAGGEAGVLHLNPTIEVVRR